MLDHAPRFDARFAAALARDRYGVDATASALPSERDQNFLLQTGAGERFVLRIANALERPEMIEAQQRAMAHVAARLPLCARVLPTTQGAPASEVAAPDGRRHLAWMVSYLPGVPLATVRDRSPELLQDIGRTVAALSGALQDFDHAAIHREFHWDLMRALATIREYRPLITDSELGRSIDALLARCERHVSPLLPVLHRSAIHNDVNDHNLLVSAPGERSPGGAPSAQHGARRCGHREVTGILDFGDMVYGCTVADLAVATAYVLLEAPDPLAAAAHVVRGYHAAFPLHDAELSALFGLMTLRLCLSACLAAHQERQQPANAYLDISQRAVRATLPRLARVPFGLAEAVFREACGLEPVAASARVRSWLRAHTAAFAPVLGIDLHTESPLVLDLSVGSPLVGADASENTEPDLTRRITGAMRDAGTRIALGRYDEPRLLYVAPAFRIGGGDEGGGATAVDAPSLAMDAEWRTIHIGLDLFADAGTPVCAPMPGTVHAVADNPAPLDYGPVIVLRHTTDDGTEFFTLYGHLSRESLQHIHAGQPVMRGQQIATLGAPNENGGWTPHLHMQIITDLLELGCDFPGVAPASQRAVWRSLSPDPNLIVGVPADRLPPAPPSDATVLERRRKLVGRNLSISYDQPLHIVRGWRQYLFDGTGRRYLDAYNNVPHVGHAHPYVVRAGQRQMALLNTNTRYLSSLRIEYVERLTQTLPEPLRVCYLVNSGSEANELALRLARAHTGARDVIVLDGAYHGHTTTLIDASPYKHAGPGGAGAPDWVHVAPLPDDFRGAYKRADPQAGPRYAQHVADLVRAARERGRSLAAFLAETCPSVGGQIIPPPGYLPAVYRSVRAAGGVCIADEVQTGLGRIGTHFWAFEAQDVVPDIVVMGKPLGNGHPMAAVVTTPEIAASFDNGMEFFSTFGGNTVSCAIGLAVLDVLRDEALQAHALHVGERLLTGLRPLTQRFAIVGDVRGSGLFLGMELVRDRDTLEPAREDAAFLVNRMREEGILLGTDGPYHNVVKIRPPMPFDEADADRLVETFERIIGDIGA
ncbi:MAG TPA: aminotransferase class III-fold pyridoxal phosphate-dependent enzyme [Gemmatimonadaceae bacterium]|nr:aminotransferase class III-fold pyridoxal phosphate-dependent enzyme [Gemmatimonadaceae bacterium]